MRWLATMLRWFQKDPPGPVRTLVFLNGDLYVRREAGPMRKVPSPKAR